MSRDIDDVISVTVNAPADVVSAADFGTVTLFTTEAAGVFDDDVYRKYGSLKAFQGDFPDAGGALLSTAELFFEQASRPQYLYVAVWPVDSAFDRVPLAEAYENLNVRWSGWYCGAPVGETLDDAELEEACAWIQAAGKIQAVTVTDISSKALEKIKLLAEKQYYRTLLLADRTVSMPGPSGAVSAAALLCSINFSASDSLLTLKFKTLTGVTPDPDMDSPTADKLDALGVNYYTNFGTKAMLAGGWMLGQVYWADEVIGLDWLKNKIQTNTFNAFAQLKKIALSDAGVTTIKGYIDAVMRMAVKNGMVGPGTWAGDKVGQLATGDYLENGYYIYADSVSTLSADDLKNRKCPPITVCAHLAGAVHSVQITVNTER
ncbi:DUF3383 domain-containing protein [Pantoea sp. JV6]|uniref:DUF3383 domain-containing protein n=1 Tax=Pantoea sp. JV6 TaxID=2981604 RepID=UPI002220CCFD|nr:DUF3383 domain-containing protein [Pantoea sp. JV6]MCW0974163.1 DUF3383 domain-containing protein [Pantoea sp. JV6]